MELDLLDVHFDLKDIKPREIEEALEDPFAVRLLPDQDRTDGEARYYALGRTVGDRYLFLCFWSDGKNVRVVAARELTEGERKFYDRKYTGIQVSEAIAPFTMKTISSWTEIPEFDSEEVEAEYWKDHELTPGLMRASEHAPDTRESTTITLRFDPRMLSRIKRIARSRFLNYQSMMKQWLAERLEEELRRSES